MKSREKRSRAKLGIALFFCMLFGALWASRANADTERDWHVRVWRKLAPGVDLSIKGTAQTSDGFLWFATKNYVLRFDGVDFESFRASDIIGSEVPLSCLIQSRDGAVWLGAQNGTLARLEAGHVQLFKSDQRVDAPRCMVEDGEHAIWVSYENGAVDRLKDGKFTRYEKNAGLPGQFAPQLVADRSGHIWFSVTGRAGVFRGGKFETLVPGGQPQKRLQMTACSTGGVWICRDNELIKYVEDQPVQECGSFAVTAPPRPMVMLESRDGTVWIGTQNNGLYHYDGKKFETVPTSNSSVSTLFEDDQGNLWVGTPEGLDEVQRRAIVIENSPAAPPSKAVGFLCQDTAGTIWASTRDERLVRREGTDWKPASLGGVGSVIDVARLVTGPDGALWIGTRQAELRRWRDGKLKTWNSSNGLSSRISALFVTAKGDVWAAGHLPVKLIHISDDKLETFDLPPKTGFIRVMAEDANGGIWMGGDQTLMHYEKGVLSNALEMIALAKPLVRTLYTTPDGSIWIGFADNGLGRLKGGKFSLVTADQGLYNDDIRQMVADDYGWLWLGSTRGIYKVRLDQLQAVADGKASRLQSVHYGPEEDLPELAASADDAGVALHTRDGRLWIPMGMALAVIDPSKLHDDLEAPPVLVKSLVVDDKVVASYGGLISPKAGVAPIGGKDVQLRFPPDHDRLEFNFAALDYQAPGNVSFRYMLEGLDHQWRENGVNRSAVYPRVPAGDYHFRVQAYNSAGVWKEAAAGVAFNVQPFFWQTWWFLTLAVAGFSAVIAGIMRFIYFRRLQGRLRELEQQTAIERDRSRIARDLHDDLGSSVSHILLLNELALRNRVTATELPTHAKQIAQTAQHIAQVLDEAVWAINPSNDGSPHLIEYLGQYAIEFLRAANVRCRLDFPEEPPLHKASADVRHNLLCATKEAINNAVRHGHPTEVRLKIETTDERFQLTIQDDGGGFQTSNGHGGGNGLRNMRERLEKIGGECDIRSRPGDGTTVVFTLPWKRTGSRGRPAAPEAH